MLPIAFDPTYVLQLPEGHRFPMDKYELLPQQLLHEGSCEPTDFFIPKTASLDDILRTHDSSYVQRLTEGSLDKSEIRKIGFPWSPAMVAREFLIAGGTIEAVQLAQIHGTAMNIAGGTHHSYPSHGEAFCMLNDQAVAAHWLLAHQKAQKILILDLDVHQGNGTAVIFQNHPAVYTCSVHGAKNYPFRKEKSDLDIGLEDQTSDEAYLNIVDGLLPKLWEEVKPDFVFYLSGVDVLATDKLGRLGLSIEGCKLRDQKVLEFFWRKNIPLSCSMGGGYSPDIKHIVEAHANTYRIAKALTD